MAYHTSGGPRVAYRKCQELTLLKPSKWQPWTPNELQGRILKANGGLRRQTAAGEDFGLFKGCKTAALDTSKRTEDCGHRGGGAAAEDWNLVTAGKWRTQRASLNAS